MYFKM